MGVMAVGALVACGSTDDSSEFETVHGETSTTTTSTIRTANTTGSTSTVNSTNDGSGGYTSSDDSGGSAGMGTSGGSGGQSGAGGQSDTPFVGIVDIVESCGFAPCGGNLAGTSWQYTRVCVEEAALLASLRSQSRCGDLELLDATGELSGTLSFDEDSYARDLSLIMETSLRVPASCVVGDCATTAFLIATELPGTTCGTTADGACTCSVPLTGSLQDTGSYATDSAQLSLGDTTGDYCASEGSLQHQGSILNVDFIYEAEPL